MRVGFLYVVDLLIVGIGGKEFLTDSLLEGCVDLLKVKFG